MKQLFWIALAIWLIPGSAPAVELGRLFFSPAERAALDRARYAVAPQETQTDVVVPILAPVADSPADLLVEPVTVNGYVSRSDGPATVWINGTDSYQGNFGDLGIDASQVRVEAARVRVPVGTQEPDVLLKPGQSFDPYSSRIRDAYETQPPLEASGADDTRSDHPQ